MAWANQRGEHTNDLEYQMNRPRVLVRDGNTCQIKGPACRSTATEVDHKINFKAGGTHKMSNLQAVCSACHKAKTQREAAAAWALKKLDAIHPDHKVRHPGMV